MNYVFNSMAFDGKTMLDIGGGRGLLSLYASCMGAKPVICLEPELKDSTSGVSRMLRRLCDALPKGNVIPRAVTFQEFDPFDQTFDIILLHNSINHLDEEACANLQISDAARSRYKLIFGKLSELAAPNAKLIICDCSRYNFFDFIRLRNPLAPTITWHIHQSPKYWSTMLCEFGFTNPKIRWMYFGGIPMLNRLSLYNRLASYFSYFLKSHFCLTMDKRDIFQDSHSRGCV
jgi:SAM-dependent methyltransferase